MGRFVTWIKIKWNKLMSRAEDPGEVLDYSYAKQQELLIEVKKGIADLVTQKKRMQIQARSLTDRVEKLTQQATDAVAANREDLARLALQRKQTAQIELSGLERQIADLEGKQQTLVENQEKLQQKINAFRTQKEVMKAQYKAAEAQVKISEAASGVGDQMKEVGLAMQRAQEKTEEMVARADAVQELEAAGVFDDVLSTASGDDIDRQLAEVSGDNAIENELAQLKAKLGPGQSASEGQGEVAQS